MSIKEQQEPIRPTWNFPPCIWGDQFLIFEEHNDNNDVHNIEKLKEEVKKLMTTNLNNSHLNLLEVVDSIQRLGIAYFFEDDIKQALTHVYETYGDKWNRGRNSLWFRIMRQHGFFVSSDVFNVYMDNEGGFNESLTNDVQGLIDLYEATYLAVPGEVILDKALTYTRRRLEEIEKDPLLNDSTIRTQIQETLRQPLHKRLPRLEALQYIPFYQQHPSHNDSLLKLAKIGFNQLQSLHKKELSQISKWWKSFNVPNKVPYARNRLVECYFWALSVYFEPQYSFSRMFLARVIAIATFLDDTYDAYGTYEELEKFTEGIQRGSVAKYQLPESMKHIYRMLMTLYEEAEEILRKLGKSMHLNYVSKAMKEYVRSYMTEAKWTHEGYIPTMEEHTEVTFISSGYKYTLAASFVAMGDVITNETFEWAFTNPPLVKSCCVLCRVMDDIVTYKEEQERKHVASGIQCYMNEFDVSEKLAYDLFNEKVENLWKEMNREFLITKDVEMPIVLRVINLARTMDVLYKKKDHFTHVGEELKNHIKSLLVNPVI